MSSARANPFGRFGYVEHATASGFVVSPTGFRSVHPASDTFRFEEPSTWWRPLATSETGQIVGLSGVGRSPSKARLDLFEPGVAFYCANGLGLKLSSTSPPFVSWADGSVGPGVPTPKVSWLLVSFRDAQPPILFAFLDGPATFEMTGRSGDWTLRTESLYRGWIRVVAPMGLEARPTNNAAELGALVERCTKEIPAWTAPAATLQEIAIKDEPTAITATWKFDRSGFVVPPAVLLAPLGGYPLKLQSAIERLDARDEDGPVAVSTEASLSIRFPVRRIPTGRGVGVGTPAGSPLGTISPIDLPSVVELALQNLACTRDALARQAAEDALGAFLTEATYRLEPFTQQQLPYGADGEGLDLVAAHALLMQSRDTAERASSEANSLLTSLVWRRDWATWRLWCDDPVLARRAGALAAVAGAICPEPGRRLDAALFEAGLAAERGLSRWTRRVTGLPKESPLLIEPLDSIRADLFFHLGDLTVQDPFVKLLLSDVRVFGEVGVQARATEGGFELVWGGEKAQRAQLILAASYPLGSAGAQNLDGFLMEEALGFTTLKGVVHAGGPCTVGLLVPEWADRLPALLAMPRYAETPR
ncbi:MAG: hypothetical protein M9921_15710 [Fimbriimonadaceae bacterium]|nr:hypothetical protein [Fimbriimonadaceae bacterium]